MSIQVAYTITKAQSPLGKSCYKLELSATRTSQPFSLFAIELLPLSYSYQQVPNMPQTMFSHVCSPQELQQYPVQADRQIPYYRQSSICLYITSLQQTQTVLASLLADIKDLSALLTILQDPQTEPQVQRTQTL